MRFYIAGPISSNLTGYKAAFAAAEADLRAQGHDCINPAENPPQPDWQSYMRISVGQLASCDGVALLKGWEHSRGARLEAHIAAELEMPIRYL